MHPINVGQPDPGCKPDDRSVPVTNARFAALTNRGETGWRRKELLETVCHFKTWHGSLFSMGLRVVDSRITILERRLAHDNMPNKERRRLHERLAKYRRFRSDPARHRKAIEKRTGSDVAWLAALGFIKKKTVARAGGGRYTTHLLLRPAEGVGHVKPESDILDDDPQHEGHRRRAQHFVVPAALWAAATGRNGGVEAAVGAAKRGCQTGETGVNPLLTSSSTGELESESLRDSDSAIAVSPPLAPLADGARRDRAAFPLAENRWMNPALQSEIACYIDRCRAHGFAVVNVSEDEYLHLAEGEGLTSPGYLGPSTSSGRRLLRVPEVGYRGLLESLHDHRRARHEREACD